MQRAIEPEVEADHNAINTRPGRIQLKFGNRDTESFSQDRWVLKTL